MFNHGCVFNCLKSLHLDPLSLHLFGIYLSLSLLLESILLQLFLSLLLKGFALHLFPLLLKARFFRIFSRLLLYLMFSGFVSLLFSHERFLHLSLDLFFMKSLRLLPF